MNKQKSLYTQQINVELTEENIANILREWFAGQDFTDKNLFTRNILFKTIKEELQKINRWKGGRGKSKKKVMDNSTIKTVKSIW